MKVLHIIFLALCLSACSADIPYRWRSFPYPKEHLSKVEKETDDHGIYIEYSGVSREQLLKQVEANLIAAGYAKVGEEFSRTVLGFSKGEERLAVKVDQFDKKLFLAVFDAQGKEPLLHGVVFGKYKLGEVVTGSEAKDKLLNELGK